MGIGYGLAMGLGSFAGGALRGNEDRRRREFEEARAIENERLRMEQAELMKRIQEQANERATADQDVRFAGEGITRVADPMANASANAFDGVPQPAMPRMSGMTETQPRERQGVAVIARRGGAEYGKTGPSNREAELSINRRMTEQQRAEDRAWRESQVQMSQQQRESDVARRQGERAEDRQWNVEDRDRGFAQQRSLLNARLAESGAPSPGRIAPAGVVSTIATNERQLSVIDEAMSALEANPDAVGAMNYLPNAIVDRMPGRKGREGVSARAAIADIGSMEIRDRSGAAVTAAEFPRLRPFIPSDRDEPDVVRTKLRRMRDVIQQETDAFRSYYSADQGFAPIPSSRGGGGPPAPVPPQNFSPNNPFAPRR